MPCLPISPPHHRINAFKFDFDDLPKSRRQEAVNLCEAFLFRSTTAALRRHTDAGFIGIGFMLMPENACVAVPFLFQQPW